MRVNPTVRVVDAAVVSMVAGVRVNDVRLGGVVSCEEVTVSDPRAGKAAVTASGVLKNTNPLASSAKTYAMVQVPGGLNGANGITTELVIVLPGANDLSI